MSYLLELGPTAVLIIETRYVHLMIKDYLNRPYRVIEEHLAHLKSRTKRYPKRLHIPPRYPLEG